MAKNKRQSRSNTNLLMAKPASEIPSNFDPDYSYVTKDLKRIGVLAGIFFAVLIIIAIVMPLLG
jgi:hypothetical protein